MCLLSLTRSLFTSLRCYLRLSPDDVAFILAPTSLYVPILYLALLCIAIGIVISPPTSLALTRKSLLSVPSFYPFFTVKFRVK